MKTNKNNLFNFSSERERERERERELTDKTSNFETTQKQYEFFKINIRDFILELRINVLNKTINQFISDMGWTNEKYYCKIVNGFKCKNELKRSNPTINYIFGGINHAIFYQQDWKNKKEEIEKLIKKYFLSSFY